jgi:RNA polymerase sigma-70 factor, ECF subfamily
MQIEQERSLRRQVLAGDEAAWRALYESAATALWGYVSWRCAGLLDRTEEITQETWLVAVRRLSDFDPAQASFITWLRGIAAHLLQNDLRTRRRRREQTLSEAIEPACVENNQREQAEQIARALAELPARYEAVLRAKYLDRASVHAIAEEWGESAKAVESLLGRARQAFRTAYERLESDVLMREQES